LAEAMQKGIGGGCPPPLPSLAADCMFVGELRAGRILAGFSGEPRDLSRAAGKNQAHGGAPWQEWCEWSLPPTANRGDFRLPVHPRD
jgi:hypothetical protein